MARRMTRRDPIESEIELALSPGLFIRDRACFSFVGGLEGVAAQIDSVLELLVETRETERLAELVHFTTDAVLENISHDATEPAAMKLEKPHPELAARLWRAQAMRIVDAGKSKYYEAAAANLERARKRYVRAGLAADWEETVRQVRADHYRKTAFMAVFEPSAASAGPREPPSFLERAKNRWGVERGGSRR